MHIIALQFESASHIKSLQRSSLSYMLNIGLFWKTVLCRPRRQENTPRLGVTGSSAGKSIQALKLHCLCFQKKEEPPQWSATAMDIEGFSQTIVNCRTHFNPFSQTALTQLLWRLISSDFCVETALEHPCGDLIYLLNFCSCWVMCMYICL